MFLAYTWIGPVDTIVMTYLMWQQIGFAAIVGVATLLLLIPLQGNHCDLATNLLLK